jgi:ubiquinone/menaquinone biosynthesis C-methylase UbiE
MTHKAAGWLTRPERIQEEDPERMIEALKVKPGMNVADVGAGVGYHVWRIAPRILPKGRVWGTDIQPEMLSTLAENVRERSLSNVVAARSTDTSTGLPTNSIDLVLMADVYHELGQPRTFLTDVRRVLRPHGRVALLEFREEDPKVPIRPEHKMSADQAIAEFAESGFCLVERFDELPWQHLLFFEMAAVGAVN